MNDNSTGVESATRRDPSSNMANEGPGGGADDQVPPLPTDHPTRRKRGVGFLLTLFVLALAVWGGSSLLPGEVDENVMLVFSLGVIGIILLAGAAKGIAGVGNFFESIARHAWEQSLLGIVAALALVTGLELCEADSRQRARYTESIPVVGNLRMRTALYQFEHGHLPGLRRGEDKQVVRRPLAAGESVELRCADTRLENDSPPGAITQSFIPIRASQDGKTPGYVPACLISDTEWKRCDDRQADQHFARELDLRVDELGGRSVRPNLVQYAALDCFGTYLSAIGVFGDGQSRLASGTGYAVLDVVRPELNTRKLMIWQKYSKVGESQRRLWVQSAAPPFDPYDPAYAHLCPIAGELITAATQEELDAAVQTMRDWGWDRDLRDPALVRRILASWSVLGVCGFLAFISGVLRKRSRIHEMPEHERDIGGFGYFFAGFCGVLKCACVGFFILCLWALFPRLMVD